MLVNAVDEKIYEFKAVSLHPSSNVTLDNLLQLLNAWSPMVSTLLGMVIPRILVKSEKA